MTAERRAQIVALLTSRDDNLPLPVRRGMPPAGFVHHTVARESCPDCLANDKRSKACETCRGRGYIETHRERDPYAVDKVQPYGLDVTRHERTRERDATIDRLTQQTRPPWTSPADELAEANRTPYRWERERKRMWATYDYPALDKALERLRQHDPQACSLIHSVYVYGWAEPSSTVEAIVDRALVFIDARMPDPIRAPGDKQPWEKRWEAKHAQDEAA